MKKIFTSLMPAMLALIACPAFAEDEISYDLTITPSPKNLSEVETGAKVTLSFDGVAVNNPYNVPVTAIAQYDDYDGDPETLRLDVDANGEVFFNFDVTAEPGTQYKLTIAKGAITSADGAHANMAKNWYYFVAETETPAEGPQLLSVDPAAGSTITPGTVINLFFDEEMDIAECTDAVTITNTDTEAEYKVTLDWNWNTFDFANLQFTMPKGLSDGNYTAYIAAGSLSGYETGLEFVGDISLNYTVSSEGGSEPQEPTPVEVKNFSPAAEQVEALSNIINIGFKSQLASLADDAAALLTNDESGKTYIGVMTILENVEKTIKVEFDYGEDANDDNYLCVAGTYTLTIAADAIIGQDGGTNAEITHSWEVIGVVDVNTIEYSSVFPENESVLTAISSITIHFPQSPALIKKSGAKISINDIEYDFSIENNILEATISPELTAEGAYEVVLPAGAVYTLSSGEGNKAITLSYSIKPNSSISLIFDDSKANTTIYNCQGVCISRNANAQDFDMLPAGLYIINGKKILKR